MAVWTLERFRKALLAEMDKMGLDPPDGPLETMPVYGETLQEYLQRRRPNRT